MKTPPQGIFVERLFPGIGKMTIPVGEAQRSVWNNFSTRTQAEEALALIKAAFPLNNLHIFDADPDSVQFIYTGGDERQFGIIGIVEVGEHIVFVDSFAGDLLDRKPSEGGHLKVNKIADAGPEITDQFPKAQAIGELVWA